MTQQRTTHRGEELNPLPHVSFFPDARQIFDQMVIPTTPLTTRPYNPDRLYYDASNLRFTESMDQIEPGLLVVDSSSRNWDKEDSNHYTLPLGEHFAYVHSIELIDGYVPASGYLVDSHHNTLHFQEGSGSPILQATIEPGNYEIQSVLSLLSTAMNQVSPHHWNYLCQLDPVTLKVTIMADHVFKLCWANGTEVVGDRGLTETQVIDPVTHKREIRRVETSNSRRRYMDNSIGKILGFRPVDLDGHTEYQGTMIYELAPYKYVGIFVNTENVDDFKKIVAPSPDNGINGAFAMVPLNVTSTCYEIKYNQVISNGRFIKTFNPPIHFNQIKIQFRSIDGQLYDFNGLDNFLIFEVKKIFNREKIQQLSSLT